MLYSSVSFFLAKMYSKVLFFQRTVTEQGSFSDSDGKISRFQKDTTMSRPVRHPWTGSILLENFDLSKFFGKLCDKNLVTSFAGNNPYICKCENVPQEAFGIGDVKAQIHLPAQIGISQYGGGGGGVSAVLSPDFRSQGVLSPEIPQNGRTRIESTASP